MKRFEGNPILQPIVNHSWESRLVFNAGAALVGGKVHLIYRAMGNDHISRLGYAASSDGYHFTERLPDPLFVPRNEQEADGCEDPRLTVLDDKLIMAYTAFGNRMQEKVFQIALTSIQLSDFLEKVELAEKHSRLPRHPQQKRIHTAPKNRWTVHLVPPLRPRHMHRPLIKL